MIKLHTLVMNLKREFWENYRMILLLPIIVSAMMLTVGIGAILYSNFIEEIGGSDKAVISNHESTEDSSISANNDLEKETTESNQKAVEPQKDETNSKNQDNDFWYMGLYFALSWLAAIFYLLGSLHRDRRDSSILFWKSMPVSDWEFIVSKYLFASLAFSFFTMLIAWGNALLLYALVSTGLSEVWMNKNGGTDFNFMLMFVWPIIVIASTWLWSAIWFAWALFCSARAQRSPILLFVLAPVLLVIAERLVISNDLLSNFLLNHSPWQLLSKMSLEPNLGELLHELYVENVGSLLISWMIAAGLLFAAVWHRTHRFESE